MFCFTVSQPIINAATANDSARCMVAESLKAKYPAARYVNVDVQTIRFTRLDLQKRYVFVTPPNVVDAIIAFDAGDRAKIKPFDVYLQRGNVYSLMQRTGGIPTKARSRPLKGLPLQERVVKTVQEHPGITRHSLRTEVLKDVKGSDLDEALDELEESGELQRRTRGSGHTKSQAFYPSHPQERLVTGNLRNSRFRRFGVRSLRVNQK